VGNFQFLIKGYRVVGKGKKEEGKLSIPH